MRVAVVFFTGKRRERILEHCKAMARGIAAQGHQADVIDGDHDVNTKLTIYQYIAVGTEAISTFGGKIPEKVGTFLSGAGLVSGKRSYAFVLKSFLSAPRALARLMQAMEKEGMFLKNSSILTSAVEAEEIGKRLHIQ
jgi:flavorubredoxin